MIAGVEAINLEAIALAVALRKAHGMIVEAIVEAIATQIEALTEEIDAAAGVVVVVGDVAEETSAADAMEATEEIETAAAGEAETEAIGPEMIEALVVNLLGIVLATGKVESLHLGAVIVINDTKAVHGEEATQVDEIEEETMVENRPGRREMLLVEANHHGLVGMPGAKVATARMLREHHEKITALLEVALQEVAERHAEIARQVILRAATLLNRVTQAAGDRRAPELPVKVHGVQRVQLQVQARGAQRVLLEQTLEAGEIKVRLEALVDGETNHKRKIGLTVGVMQAPRATGLQKEISQAGNFFTSSICHVQT